MEKRGKKELQSNLQRDLLLNQYLKKQRRWKYVFVIWLFILGIGILFYLLHGVVKISLKEIFSLFLRKLPFFSEEMIRQSYPVPETKRIILEMIRIPRVINGILVGGGLAIAGVALQGIFRNPLVDPYVTGISSGATFGVTIAMLIGFHKTWLGWGGITLFAFFGAFITALLFFLLFCSDQKISNSSILLIGISVNLFFSGVVSFLLFLNHDKIESIVLWTMGSLANPNWNTILISAPILFLGFIGLLFCARALDFMVIDHETAEVYGIPVRRYQYWVILFASLVTSVCVSFSGVIGFVGLVIPNIVRLLFGMNHKVMLLFSFLFGAIFLSFSDFLARSILSPTEIPVGIVTSLIGVPFFLFLIYRNGKEEK